MELVAVDAEVASYKKFCNVCTNKENDEEHRNTPQHKVNEMLLAFYQNRTAMRNPKHGVQLSMAVNGREGFSYNFNTEPDKKGNHYLKITPEDFKRQDKKIEFICSIKNGRTKINSPIYILYAGVLQTFQPYSMIYPNGEMEQDKFIELDAGDSYVVIVRLTLEECHVSNFKIPVCFYFQAEKESGTSEAFVVARSIVVAIQDYVPEKEKIVEKSPFTSNKWEKVAAVPMDRRIFSFRRKTQEDFPIPKGQFKTLLFGLKKDFQDGVLQAVKEDLKPGHTTLDKYEIFYHQLLWLEETCAILGLSCYNMEDVKLNFRAGNILELTVPGLAEKRPSVLKGDMIEMKIHGDHTSYEGKIREVTDCCVVIEGINSILIQCVIMNPNINIDVRFKLRRLHFERMHQGVDQVVASGFVDNLFPSVELLSKPISMPIQLTEEEFRNKNIFNNQEQFTAVQKIINKTSASVPYIVWGPPGTGKTVTIVEAIYHLKRLTKSKILVCAPANAACNMLTSKLVEFCDTSELQRIMSENCDLSSVHESIIPYCNVMKTANGSLQVIPFIQSNVLKLNKIRVVVTTLVFAGRFTREYHPDVLFVDEAAQAREPEVCCAIGLLAKNKQLILAGDPMQLGPVINSELCKKYKLDISLLERLMQHDLYQIDTEHNFITMLKSNFRSHAEILKLPNELFYDNKLQAASVSVQSDPLAKMHLYKVIHKDGCTNQTGAPIEFHSVLSTERREGRSPSYYNLEEVYVVKQYVKALMNLRFPNPVNNISLAEIGVVTPYIRQMYKIREALHEYRDIEIGTTESFQGREKRVIIISTVRAQEDLLLYDGKYRIGFVKEPKRFNVAITRAKSKVILIGNPLVLTKDDKWGRLILQSKALGTLCGAPFPVRDLDQLHAVINRLKMFPKNEAVPKKS
ncbi:putative helicase mov-10-B.1 isoform X1 [Euwallacea fornicatus]|uniref:putative helicase mov-10-B.1 isoform X1 n=2 Tax=Euwallacea fornicatus TaxID=995702 RepID=UPI00338E1465